MIVREGQLLLIAFLAVVDAAGCHWIFPFGSAADGADRAIGPLDVTGAEARRTDVPSSLERTPLHDRLRAEGALAPDGAPRDGALKDGTPQDTRPRDSGLKDQPALLDTAGPQACNPALAAPSQVVNHKMVFCKAKSGYYTQCQAASLCAPAGGWALCPASAYRAVFDGTGAPPPTSDQAWLAGCVRDGGSLTGPTDAACSKCDGLATPSVTVSWDCTTFVSAAISAAKRLGLSPSALCQTVGVNDPANAGFWVPQSTASGKPAAVCCRP